MGGVVRVWGARGAKSKAAGVTPRVPHCRDAAAAEECRVGTFGRERRRAVGEVQADLGSTEGEMLPDLW